MRRLALATSNLSIKFDCNLAHLYLAPRWGLEFRRDPHRQKTGVPELWCGVVCVIVSLGTMLACDRRTDI